ncbi:MAG: ribonuclease T2-like [Geoglossum simile]|nr:MAG: ribonuclease T2-like [Geoglossum simile]
MSEYWKPNSGTDDHFWAHEWSKHGTCVSTMQPKCYGYKYERGEEVPAYFQKAVDLFKGLDTYQFLEAAGITPSETSQYTCSQVEAAIKDATGFDATVMCDTRKKGELREVYYHFNVIGTLQDGRFVHTDPGESNPPSCGALIDNLPS